MNDNQVISAIIAALRLGLNSYGLSSVKIKQSYQPIQSGAETGPTVYLHKIVASRWGWPGRKDLLSTVLQNPSYPAFGFSREVGPSTNNNPTRNFNNGNFAPAIDRFQHTDVFYRSATWQVDGLATQNPRTPNQLTASDIVECAADALQSLETITALTNQRIRIERIQSVRESYFVDDRDRHEQAPSFDFTVTYRVNRISIVQPVERIDCLLHRI